MLESGLKRKASPKRPTHASIGWEVYEDPVEGVEQEPYAKEGENDCESKPASACMHAKK